MSSEKHNFDIKLRKKIDLVFEQAQQIIINKPVPIKLAITCLLAGGNLLLEDRPGMGKTSLMKTLAKLFGLPVKRIQFTNDILPADIIGTSVFVKGLKDFNFIKGPLFSNFVLADEINRSSPRTQSAFLQAMEEKRVSIDGHTFDLPKPFFVIATQNPMDSQGTFALPESQIDRFMMCLSLGLPGREAEREILIGEDRNIKIEKLQPVLNKIEVCNIMAEVNQIYVSDSCLDYLQDIIEKSRSDSEGLSPRAARDYNQAAKAYAYVCGRDFVIPEDYQSVGLAIMSHRISVEGHSNQNTAQLILKSVEVP